MPARSSRASPFCCAEICTTDLDLLFCRSLALNGKWLQAYANRYPVKTVIEGVSDITLSRRSFQSKASGWPLQDLTLAGAVEKEAFACQMPHYGPCVRFLAYCVCRLGRSTECPEVPCFRGVLAPQIDYLPRDKAKPQQTHSKQNHGHYTGHLHLVTIPALYSGQNVPLLLLLISGLLQLLPENQVCRKAQDGRSHIGQS